MQKLIDLSQLFINIKNETDVDFLNASISYNTEMSLINYHIHIENDDSNVDIEQLLLDIQNVVYQYVKQEKIEVDIEIDLDSACSLYIGKKLELSLSGG